MQLIFSCQHSISKRFENGRSKFNFVFYFQGKEENMLRQIFGKHFQKIEINNNIGIIPAWQTS